MSHLLYGGWWRTYSKTIWTKLILISKEPQIFSSPVHLFFFRKHTSLTEPCDRHLSFKIIQNKGMTYFCVSNYLRFFLWNFSFVPLLTMWNNSIYKYVLLLTCNIFQYLLYCPNSTIRCLSSLLTATSVLSWLIVILLFLRTCQLFLAILIFGVQADNCRNNIPLSDEHSLSLDKGKINVFECISCLLDSIITKY